MLTREQFLQSYPQFCTNDVNEVDHALTIATAVTPANAWGEKQNIGIALYAAHILTNNWQQLTQIASDANSIASGKPSGGTVGSGSEDTLDDTTFGKQYKAVRDTVPATGISFNGLA